MPNGNANNGWTKAIISGVGGIVIALMITLIAGNASQAEKFNSQDNMIVRNRADIKESREYQKSIDTRLRNIENSIAAIESVFNKKVGR